jgi:hypothetical protein
VDTRRPPKERGLGIPDRSGGIVFPYGILDETGPLAVAQGTFGGREVVVFWSRLAQSAGAFHPEVEGQRLTFTADAEQITDQETGSIWRADGFAMGGALQGQRLNPVEDAFVAFWFAWPAFYPEIEIWGTS